MKHHLSGWKRLTALVAIAAGSTLPVAVFAAAPTSATVTGSGYVEICKAFTVPPIHMNPQPVVSFTVSGGGGTVSVQSGTCSPPISVAAGTVTITEASQPWYQATAITALAGSSYLDSVDLANQTATVTVTPNANVATVTFTDDPVTGYVEICKQAQSGSGLFGNYSFTLSGEDDYTGTATVPVGACSQPVQVPAGTLTTAEAGSNLYVTGIVATRNGVGNMLVAPAPNLTTGVANVSIEASSDPSVQTDVTYTNNVVALKICKAWDPESGNEPGGASTLFPFAFSASGVPGPNGAPLPVTLMAGTPESPVCSNPTMLRPGTSVTITEGVVPGSKVENIWAGGALSVVPNTLSLTNRTITVIVGTPITSASAPTNEGVVTFEDGLADPGTLKICALPSSTPGTATSYSYAVSGYPNTVTVPLGSCEIVGTSSTDPFQFPFNTTVTVTQLATAGAAAQSISVIPQYLTEYVAGVATLTTWPVLSGPPMLGGSGKASSVAVVIGEQTLTEVDFTDGAAADPVTPSDPPSTSAPSSVSPSITSDPAPVSVPSGIVPVILPTVTTPPQQPQQGTNPAPAVVGTSKVKALVLARDRKALVKVNKAIMVTRHSLAKYRAAIRRHLPQQAKLVAAEKRLQLRLKTLLALQKRLHTAIVHLS